MKISSRVKCTGIAFLLFQGMTIAHELVHQAIYKYAGIPTKLKIGILWGEVVPEYVAPDYTLRTGLMVANSINEALLPIEILLILILLVLIYNVLERKRKREGDLNE